MHNSFFSAAFFRVLCFWLVSFIISCLHANTWANIMVWWNFFSNISIANKYKPIFEAMEIKQRIYICNVYAIFYDSSKDHIFRIYFWVLTFKERKISLDPTWWIQILRNSINKLMILLKYTAFQCFSSFDYSYKKSYNSNQVIVFGIC